MATSTDFPSEEEDIDMLKNLIESRRQEFEEHLEPSKILKNLNGIDEETKQSILDTKELDSREQAVGCLIDVVKQQNIVSDFFQVLRETGFMKLLDEKKIPDKTTMAPGFSDVKSPASRLTDQGEDPLNLDDTERDGDDDDDKDNFSDEVEDMDTSDEKDELPMRKYQQELSKVAIQGNNTIICAPTGSGKTRVALYIVKDHLSNATDRGKKKVVFLARTTPLVNQQYKSFRKHLPKARVLYVTGDTAYSTTLHTVLDYFDIFVLTPQILDNNLTDEKIKSLSQFSLLILDECHHTRKGEPYNTLMKKFLKAKKAREDDLPQIVGLTASLGVEKASTDGEATISILKLCANLDVRKLSTVTVNKAELEKTIPKPDEREVKLDGSRCDKAREQIHKTMLKIEHHLDEAVLNLGDREISALKRKRPTNLNNQSYGQWAVEIKRSAMRVNGPTEVAKALARTIVVTARQLEVYNASMDIHDLVRLSDVLEFLEKTLTDNLETNKHSRVETELSTYFRDLKLKLKQFAIEDENPNLMILKKEILKLRNEKGSDSLGIIFVKTRGTCYAICEWMKSDGELRELNAEPFTGAGANVEEGGMTQNQQDVAISNLKSGATKFLVATSVAEEGLDIPDCNIVIRYNHVGNEITTVQTRGRSRKRGGTSVLLGMEEVLKMGSLIFISENENAITYVNRKWRCSNDWEKYQFVFQVPN